MDLKKFYLRAFLFAIIGASLFSGCHKEPVIDPFWEISLDWDKKLMIEKLNEYSREGKIENCVFSFEKVSYVKNDQMDVRISSILSKPEFNNDILQSLNYSLIAELKNDPTMHFNKDFYHFFKGSMTNHYGQSMEEVDHHGKIYVSWNFENQIQVETTIIKEINHYMIDIRMLN